MKVHLRRLLDWIRRIDHCPECGLVVPAAVLREWGSCTDCFGPVLAEYRLAPFREAWTRLVAKRGRYAAKGGKTAATDASILRVIRRMEGEVARWPAPLRVHGVRTAAAWIGATPVAVR